VNFRELRKREVRRIPILGSWVNSPQPTSQGAHLNALGCQLQEVMQSGKVSASGVFADARGAFFVLEVDSADELFDLFAPLIDSLRIETHPLITVEKLGEFLESDAMASS